MKGVSSYKVRDFNYNISPPSNPPQTLPKMFNEFVALVSNLSFMKNS